MKIKTLEELLPDNKYTDDKYFREKVVGRDDDTVFVRPVEKEDINAVVEFDNWEYEQEFIICRCLKRINQIDRGKDEWSWVDWFAFIKTLNIRDKLDYIGIIREISYKEDGEYEIYL